MFFFYEILINEKGMKRTEKERYWQIKSVRKNRLKNRISEKDKIRKKKKVIDIKERQIKEKEHLWQKEIYRQKDRQKKRRKTY